MVLPAETAVDILVNGVLMIVVDISSGFYHMLTSKYNLNQSETQINHDS